MESIENISETDGFDANNNNTIDLQWNGKINVINIKPVFRKLSVPTYLSTDYFNDKNSENVVIENEHSNISPNRRQTRENIMERRKSQVSIPFWLVTFILSNVKIKI